MVTTSEATATEVAYNAYNAINDLVTGATIGQVMDRMPKRIDSVQWFIAAQGASVAMRALRANQIGAVNRPDPITPLLDLLSDWPADREDGDDDE